MVVGENHPTSLGDGMLDFIPDTLETGFGHLLELLFSSNSCCLEHSQEPSRRFTRTPARCSDRWFQKLDRLSSSDSSDSSERLQHYWPTNLCTDDCLVRFKSRYFRYLSTDCSRCIATRKVDVEDGIAVAKAEDERNRSSAAE